MGLSNKIIDLRKYARDELKNLDEYSVIALESDILLSNVINKDRVFLEINPLEEVSNDLSSLFLEQIERRKSGTPIAYILKKKEFMEYEFLVEEGVLIPRDDTQSVVEITAKAVLELDKSSILGFEVGIGSGIISIILLSKVKNLNMIASDINDKAIKLSMQNIDKINKEYDLNIKDRIKIYNSSFFYDIEIEDSSLDFIVSNPPYIPSEDVASLEKSVRDFEPISALDGGKDGLDFYRNIIKLGYTKLKNNGFFSFEIGYNQSYDMIKLMKEYDLKFIKVYKDLSGRDRSIIGYKKG